MKFPSFAPVPGALALAIGQILWASSAAHADQPVVAENGNVVLVDSVFIATAGNNQTAITARTGGQVQAQNTYIATSGNASQGVHVRGAGSRFDSQSVLNIFTSGTGSSGLLVEEQGAAIVQSMALMTTGRQAHGVQTLRGAETQLFDASVTTHGEGSYGLDLLGGDARLAASNLDIETFGDLASGVHVNNDSTVQLNDSSITTEGAQARGIYAIGGGASVNGERLHITTRGDNASGVYALDTDQVLTLQDFKVSTHGNDSHGVQIDQAQASLHNGEIHVDQGYGLWAGGMTGAGGPASIDASNLRLVGGGVRAIAGAAVVLRDSHIVTGRDGAVALSVARDGSISLDNVTAHASGVDSAVARMEGGSMIARNSDMAAASGQALDVRSGINSFELDGGTLAGAVQVADGASLDLILRNGAIMDGHLQKVTHMQVLDGAHWNMDASSNIGALHLDGGVVSFGNPQQFYTLTTGELTGNGVFALSLNMQDRQIDFLDITGQASGDHRVRIQNSGSEPLQDFDPLHVIRTGGGDAHFALIGERVDLGAFSYELRKTDDDWYLSGERSAVSPSTRTVQALFNSAPTIWYGELSTLRSRMGEVRGTGQAGMWMRSYGNKYNVDTGGGLAYRQQQMGFSLGADTTASTLDGQWLVGALGGYSRSDLALSRGSSGQVDSYYLGGYASWLAEDGWYTDTAIKFNQYHNRADVSMSDGTRAVGDYISHGLGGSVELGRHIKLGDELFVEPFGQLSGMVVRGRKFRLDNGLQAQNDQTSSLLGKAGATLGRTYPLATGGIVQPYVKAAVAHEFAHGNQVQVNGHRFANDLSGTRGELAAGVAVAMAANVQLHGHVDYLAGEQIEQPWGVNVGLRYAFD